jgi:hypothetical protein
MTFVTIGVLCFFGALIYGTFQNVASLSRDVEAIKDHLDRVMPLPDDDDDNV